MDVLKELTEGLESGLKKYNHGVRVDDDDTRSWVTSRNSWLTRRG